MAPVFNFLVDLPDKDVGRYAATKSLDAALEADSGLLARISSKGDLCWCLQSYLLLKPRGLPVKLSNRLAAEAVNIVHSDHLLNLRGWPDDFVVSVQADFPRRGWAHHHLVQNRAQMGPDSSYIPLWPQPHLIGRDPERQGVTTVAYAGEIVNGNLAGGVEAWKQRFARHGMAFVQPPSGAWHDMSAIDVMIGVRSFDKRPYNGKPPSKMVNAWHARIPFIGGYDSAFLQTGSPGEDYLRAETPDAVVAAALWLRDDPALYAMLVSNGTRKAALYTQDAIAQTWERVLTETVTQRLARWRTAPRYERVRFAAALSAGLSWHHGKQIVKMARRRLSGAGLSRPGSQPQ
ncbi:MAG TPA: hypothetical protein VGM83_21305 [Devosiaceae bacterium]|jgi:hypothetical protein